MRQGKLKELPRGVRQVRDALERWRRTRRKRSAIPEKYWQSAVRLAKEYGVSQTANALRLNYGDLKKRMQGVRGESLPVPVAEPTFVEVDWQSGMPCAPWAVEMEHRSGAKLKITLGGQAGAVDIVALGEAFWRQKL